MGKFALRGLAESMARELQPQNIHVGHVVIDGGIANPGRDAGARGADGMLSPDAIAESYPLSPPSASFGVELGDRGAAVGRKLLRHVGAPCMRRREKNGPRRNAAQV